MPTLVPHPGSTGKVSVKPVIHIPTKTIYPSPSHAIVGVGCNTSRLYRELNKPYPTGEFVYYGGISAKERKRLMDHVDGPDHDEEDGE